MSVAHAAATQRYRRSYWKLTGADGVLVIHEAMKTPCIVLEGMIATGEFLRACPQHEYIFWREIWLRRQAGDAARRAPSHS